MGSILPNSIPLIDLALFKSPTTRIQTARSLVQACHDVGFVYITNHGIPASRIEEAFFWTQKLFSLPDEKKALAKHNDATNDFRGWSCLGKEQAPSPEGEEEDGRDWNVRFEIGSRAI